MSAAESESAPKLPILGLLANVWRIYARHWRLLIPLALIVLLPQAISDAIELHVDTEDFDAGRAALAGVTSAGIVATNLAGEALYAGMITALVVEWLHGILRPSLPRLARELPIMRLIAADVLIAVGTALGLVLLIVPGVIFATYTLITTVVIELQDASIREGFERSVSLVRGSFRRVLAIGAVLIAGTEAVTALLVAPFHGFAAEAGVHLGVGALLEPFQGVATVLVALALMELRGGGRLNRLRPMGRLIHFEIHAEDPERAIEFYKSVFGWGVTKWDGPVDYWLLDTGEETEPGINGAIMRRVESASPAGDAPNAFICTIQVGSIEDSEKAIPEAGGEQVAPRQEIPGVGKVSYFKDTEGNIFGALEPAPRE